MTRDEQTLRRLLAYRVAGALLYADDGELQDNSTFPYIDFKRDPVSVIEQKLIDRTILEQGRAAAAGASARKGGAA